jgi:signal transduction histidine kinase
MIAHDLRSPLMSIKGIAELMAEETFGSVTPEQKKWLLRIHENGNSLIDLVSDFLDVSKLESGYVDVRSEVTDLTALIHESIETNRVLAAGKNISLRGSIDPSIPLIQGDPRRLEQVLSNLISNAIKFTGQDGEVEVGAARADTNAVNVWVRDNGEGIPADELGQLFEKYRQGDNVKNSNDKGTGLGLVICKMIVEAHGGKMSVESELKKGTSFYFSLPLV